MTSVAEHEYRKLYVLFLLIVDEEVDMATRSFIVDSVSDRGIYCHWDGYPEHNGYVLNHFYNSQEKVDELINLGDLSVLGVNVTKDGTIPHEFVDEESGETAKYSQFTEAYHRDKGEEFDGVKPTEYATKLGKTKYPSDVMGAEWVYFWNGSEWSWKRC